MPAQQETDAPSPWVSVALVGAGGAAGTTVRYLLDGLLGGKGGLGAPDWLPAGILVVNISGAFLMGVLLGRLGRGDGLAGRARTLQLLLGTGLIGGYTTYSALADDTALLLLQGRSLEGLVYLLGTLLLGLAASGLGLWAGGAGTRGERR